ncbi:phosphoribosylaminoimidazolesuccinocarboxamide synthase [Candidatus Nitrosocosmicus arcticus]|uniref:Phosphoribosylaminoimidazole-succinocarboxamide synthase n=1 Tax=Candidatus Nitrosocosmicus arcticus TaxID=2035267 RepID=A0A557STJ1_9ARCH|nr:phosphoribosylaminoimidazolesuccinocarboxamide synthase [Candidatus Nitrosocosmicus arcticus]TVP39920.1 Phosphoribosylaminoimidazole-succinocarboxamide synthase [Candidatus Nitrosocosmicus arcticus]
MKLIRIGKVKDIYETKDNTLILSFSDRVSAFDVILNDEIPCKGKVLCDFALFWFKILKGKNHFRRRVAPSKIEVKKLNMIPIECVVRSYLYGSLYSRYLQNDIDITGSGKYFANKDLQLAAKLPALLFDPTTKSDQHDKPLSETEILKNKIVSHTEFSQLKKLSLDLFSQVNAIVSASGFILSDIKFEFGKDQKTGEIMLGDSIGPDEFRIWNKDDYQVGQTQDSYDKQILRDWLEDIGFRQEIDQCNNNNTHPKIPKLPKDIIEKVSQRYIDAYERITRSTFEKLD